MVLERLFANPNAVVNRDVKIKLDDGYVISRALPTEEVRKLRFISRAIQQFLELEVGGGNAMIDNTLYDFNGSIIDIILSLG